MSKTTTNKQYTDNDHPWKLILQYFLHEAVLFLKPQLNAMIDWDRGFEFLEQELHEAIQTRFKSAKLVDKLAKVFLQDGSELSLLVHVEIESSPDADFPTRFFWYRVLIFDKHKTDNIYSMAIFTGPNSMHQAGKYQFELLDNNLTFSYPAIKIWELKEEDLIASDNIFALLLLAQQYANASKKDMDKRLAFRKRLFDLALEKKIPKQQILQCLIFVKYLTALPEDMEREYTHYRSERLGQKSSDMWLTMDIVKEFDTIMEQAHGVSLQKQLREAETAAAEAEKARQQAAAEAEKARQQAAAELLQTKKKTILNMHHQLNLDIKNIASIVEMTEEEVRAVIAQGTKLDVDQ